MRTKELLSDYNGDYKLYLEKGDKPMPMIVVVINNYEGFNEIYENDYDDTILTITREGLKYGIIFVTTASSFNDLRYRLSQNFKQKLALQLNKEDDFYNIFEKVGKKRPSHVFGRGLFTFGDEVYEFQTAKICDGGQYNTFIGDAIEKLKQNNQLIAKSIPVLPDKISVEDIKNNIKNITKIPIGMDEKTLKIYSYSLKKNYISIISSKKMEDAVEFSFYVLEAAKLLNNVDIVVLNAEKMGQDNNCVNDYNDMVSKITEEIDNHVICLIVGIDKLLSYIDEFEFKQTLENAQEKGKYNFIIVENATKLKDHSYDEWYKEFISDDSGIWVGNGIDSQYLINITADRRELNDNCGRDFGYVVKDGNYTMIKLLGMKKAGDDYE